MARCKPVATFTVASLKDADNVLAELAELERRAALIANILNENIDAAKAKAAEEMVEVSARKKVLEAALSSFALINKNEYFKDKKSRELDFGTLSFRQSTKLVKAGKSIKTEMVLAKIKEYGFVEAIRTKEEVNQESMTAWPDDKLEKVGMKRKIEDVFGYQLKQHEPGEIG